jgi:hypothetical protein
MTMKASTRALFKRPLYCQQDAKNAVSIHLLFSPKRPAKKDRVERFKVDMEKVLTSEVILSHIPG